MSRKFAVFDVDGTIIRWQLYHAIGDELARQGIISQTDFSKVRRARMNWKRRAGEDSFKDYELTLVQVFNQAIVGLEYDKFKVIVGSVFDQYKEQVYMYTRDLIEKLRKQNYLLFAVSGSPQMIIDLIVQYYGFDDGAGGTYEVIDGKFTGQADIPLGRKKYFLEQLIKKYDATLDDSIGVGDSEGDIEMLTYVEQPLVFNPTKNLLTHAQEQSWPIIIERKNVVYKLTADNGKYNLE